MKNRRTLIKLTLLFLISILLSINPAVSTTWSIYENRLTASTVFEGAPAITQTSDMKVWVAYEKDVGGYRAIYYTISPDLGASWSTPKNITRIPSSDQNQDPSIVQISNGNIWVVWTALKTPPDFKMTATPAMLSIPRGNSDTSTITVTSLNYFSEPVDLSVRNPPEGVTATLNPTRVTPPPDGEANSTLTITVGATATPGSYIIIVSGRSPSTSHSVTIELEIPAGSTSASSRTELVPDGFPSATTPNYEIYYKWSNDNGASWSNDIQLTDNPTDDLAPSILQAANGVIWIVWSSDRTGNYEIFYKTSSNLGASWSNDIQLTFDSIRDARPAIAQTKDGKIWVAWYSDRYGDSEILYKIYDGLSWSIDMRLTIHTNRDTGPAILQTIDEVIWIFWGSSGNGPSDTGDIYYKYSSDNGATWSESIRFTTDSNEDMWPSITQTVDTRIWVVWTSNRGEQPDGNYDIYYRRSLAGDVNEDGVVDIVDLSLVGVAFGRFEGETGYNPSADLNKDGIIDVWDISIVCLYYGET